MEIRSLSPVASYCSVWASRVFVMATYRSSDVVEPNCFFSVRLWLANWI